MNIHLKLFAVVRDLTGTDEVVLTLPSGSRVSALLQSLFLQYPQLQNLEHHVRIAVNWEYTPSDEVLHDNDEVALIPPVSGG